MSNHIDLYSGYRHFAYPVLTTGRALEQTTNHRRDGRLTAEFAKAVSKMLQRGSRVCVIHALMIRSTCG
jgi:hypothetical protein